MARRRRRTRRENLVTKIQRHPFAAAGAFLSAVVLVGTSLPYLQEIEPIVRFRLVQYVTDQMNPVSRSVDRLIKSQAESDLYKAQHEPGAAKSEVVQQRVKDLQLLIDETNARLKK